MISPSYFKVGPQLAQQSLREVELKDLSIKNNGLKYQVGPKKIGGSTKNLKKIESLFNKLKDTMTLSQAFELKSAAVLLRDGFQKKVRESNQKASLPFLSKISSCYTKYLEKKNEEAYDRVIDQCNKKLNSASPVDLASIQASHAFVKVANARTPLIYGEEPKMMRAFYDRVNRAAKEESPPDLYPETKNEKTKEVDDQAVHLSPAKEGKPPKVQPTPIRGSGVSLELTNLRTPLLGN